MGTVKLFNLPAAPFQLLLLQRRTGREIKKPLKWKDVGWGNSWAFNIHQKGTCRISVGYVLDHYAPSLTCIQFLFYSIRRPLMDQVQDPFCPAYCIYQCRTRCLSKHISQYLCPILSHFHLQFSKQEKQKLVHHYGRAAFGMPAKISLWFHVALNYPNPAQPNIHL